MRRTALAVALAALLPLAAAAQEHPDFNGAWKINLTKSDAAPPGRGGQQMDLSKLTLTITQTAETITIVQSGVGPERTTTYYLDGRESVNQAMRGEMKSTSRWDGGNLVTEGTSTFEGPNGQRTMTMSEVRTLSEDGKTLTLTSTTDTPMGKRTRTTVFDRQ